MARRRPLGYSPEHPAAGLRDCARRGRGQRASKRPPLSRRRALRARRSGPDLRRAGAADIVALGREPDRNLKLGATAFGDILSLTVSDVTALKKREASFRLLFDNNPMPMWVFDAETTAFLSVNDAAVQHYGYSRARFLRMTLREIWPEDEWVSHTQALQQVGDAYHSGRNWRHLKADGS